MNEAIQLTLLRERFYRRERRSVPAAREFVREALAGGALGARADDVLLCVSELATNALLHGVPPGRGYLLRVWAAVEHGLLRVEVHDSGDGAPCARAAEAGAESGRGLLLVGAVADRWGVEERSPGKVVWCEVECAGRDDDGPAHVSEAETGGGAEPAGSGRVLRHRGYR